jgi:hypothetical protein
MTNCQDAACMTECSKIRFLILFVWANLYLSLIGFAQTYTKPFIVEELPSPSKMGAVPNLFKDHDGKVWLSWVEFLDDSTDVLKYSLLEDDKWSTVNTISQGNNWFVNWADFPSFTRFPGLKENYLLAHWLQKSASGTFDYDIRISINKPGLSNWSPSAILHQDGIPAEHGFVSLLPEKVGKIRAFWLDGRLTKGHEEEAKDSKDDHGGHHGTMTLHTALIDTSGMVSDERMLDSRICDCCQTAAAMLENGPVVVYRDRSEREIRDISIVRFENGGWSEPTTIYNDEWMIAGCPVNGPAISANKNKLAIAWFTGKNKKGEVKVIFSEDGGRTFGKPVVIDNNGPVGRVDIHWLNEKQVAISWISNQNKSAKISLQIIHSNGKKGLLQHIKDTSAERLSGFPILVPYNNGFILSTTEVNSDKSTHVKTYRLSTPE